MEKKNKIILVAIIILVVSVVGIGVYSCINNKNINNDAIKFFKEYSKLNDKVNEENGKNYVNVDLNKTNTVKYLTGKEAISLLKSGTGVIYFGFASCPWCRTLITPLTKICEDKKETLYYLDILDIRSKFEIKDGELNKTKNGSKEYYELLNTLDEYLNDFTLTDDSGREFYTDEKRLYAPTLVAFKDGKITCVHIGTVKSQASGYEKLSDEELKELEHIIKELIYSKNKEVCTSGTC